MNMRKIYATLFLTILVGMPVFSAMMSAQMPSAVQDILPILMLLFAIMANIENKKIRIPTSIDIYYVGWFLFLLVALLGIKRNGVGTVRIFSCIFLPFLLRRNCEWLGSVRMVCTLILGINVFFTFFFFAFPQFYDPVINFYGYIPSGTSGGTAGYRAGIANHYSQNGIFISVLFMMLVIYIMAGFSFNKRVVKHIKSIVFTVAVFVALLLTGKRGVLVWSLLAIIVTYLISSKHKIGKIGKLILIILAAFGVLQILSEIVPAISYVFERFQDIGDDTASLERLAMWKLAYEKFKTSPIFGTGFWSYRNHYANNLAAFWHPNVKRYQYLDAHNVYIQVLCETGIIGETIYLAAIGMLLFQTIKLAGNIYVLDSVELRFGVMFSLCIQLFYCAYSLTGNCLYDIVFYFYSLAAAMVLSINNEMHRRNLSENRKG